MSTPFGFRPEVRLLGEQHGCHDEGEQGAAWRHRGKLEAPAG